jgi:hypothetical protein
VAPNRGFSDVNDETPPNPSMMSKNHAQILQSTSVANRPLTDIIEATETRIETVENHQENSQETPNLTRKTSVPPSPLLSSDITEKNLLKRRIQQRLQFNLSQPERPRIHTKRLIISMEPAMFEAFKAISERTGHSMARLMRGAIDVFVEMYPESHEVSPVKVTSIPIDIGETITKKITKGWLLA